MSQEKPCPVCPFSWSPKDLSTTSPHTTFINTMGKVNSEGFHYLSKQFLKVSTAKLKEGIFVCHIPGGFNGYLIAKAFNLLELKAWPAFKWIWANILANNKSHAYKDRVVNIPDTYKEI